MLVGNITYKKKKKKEICVWNQWVITVFLIQCAEASLKLWGKTKKSWEEKSSGI